MYILVAKNPCQTKGVGGGAMGARNGIRVRNSLRPICSKSELIPVAIAKPIFITDLHCAKVALCQLSYGPFFRNISLEDFWKSIFLFYCLGLIDFKEKEEGKFKPGGEKNFDEILTLERELDSLNYYQILKVSPSAYPEEIKRAYFNFAKLYHPDRFAKNVSPEIKEKAQRIFVKITKAYETLIDPKKRKEYDSSPKKEKTDFSKDIELKFRKAKALYKDGKYREAIALLKDILKYKKDKGSYFLLLALCQSKIPAFHKQAEENFLEAIRLEPWNAECYVGLGLLYKSENMPIRASKQFEKALSIDNEHPIARRELELIRGKKEKPSLKDLLKMDLGSFFKKKK